MYFRRLELYIREFFIFIAFRKGDFYLLCYYNINWVGQLTKLHTTCV